MSVLKLISKNFSDEEIAQDLQLDIAEINGMHKSLLEKTGCNNNAALVMYAIKNKVIII
jgi:DNA-binding NarL/FixJ family response regulator